MAQGYYTLDEAAKILGITSEKLTKLAQDPGWLKKVHAFRDQKVMRFRSQDIDALAGQGGVGGAQSKDPGVFDFPMPDSSQVGIGHEPLGQGSSSTPKAAGQGKKMDSDVHLVLEGEDEFNPASDSGIRKDSGSSSKSDVKLGVMPESSGGSKPDSGASSKSGSGVRKKTMIPPGSRVDSPVRLVPMSSTEDVEAIQHEAGRGADSDVALGGSHPSGGKAYPGAGQEMGTEEVDLDAEMRRAQGQKPSSKVKPKSGVGERGHFEVAEDRPRPDSDESTELDLSAEDIQMAHGEDVSLGELTPKDKIKGASGTSGLQMHSPADSGVDLEKAGEPDESEFELSLEASDHGKGHGPKTPAAAEPEGSSEFELTLEDSGKLAPLEEEGGDKDIFESDFDMPALEEESGSEAVALDESDTDSSSDFDLALNEEDAAAEGESGSQVVTLDEEEADEEAATVARPRPKAAEGEEAEEIDELLGKEAEEEEAMAAAAAAPTEWGLVPAIVMTPAVLIMIFVGLMSFELLHSMWGYKQPSKASGPITEFFVNTFVPEKDVPDEMKTKKR
jgi:hypothetical protein